MAGGRKKLEFPCVAGGGRPESNPVEASATKDENELK
jgi:hypothetical protein